jgi:plastocyanin
MLRTSRIALAGLAFIAFAATAQAANHVVRNEGQTFVPRNLTIRVGDTVTWVGSTDGSFHNVVADDNSYTSGSAASGAWSYSHTFTAVGTYPYYCTPHGGPGGTGQSGAIVVIDALEISHGSDLFDDLGGAPDKYRISQSPYSSYEIVVEPAAGEPGATIERLAGTTTTVLQAGVAVSALGMAQSLRWVNPTVNVFDTDRIQIRNPHCPTAGAAGCTSNDVYRLRAYETTYAIPRYNQSGSQVSVLILQNPTNYSITGAVYFWTTGGTLLNGPGHNFTLPAKTALVLNVGTMHPSLPGTSGTVTIAHTGRYGDLTGKMVALEPATGFSFDTPMVPRVK